MIDRRSFLRGMSAIGAAAWWGRHPERADGGELETTRLRLARTPAVCFAPQFVAQELLNGEGFTDVEYVVPERRQEGQYRLLAEGKADLNVGIVAQFIIQVDAGDPIVILSGTHAGCFELFGTDRIRTVKDLKGATVAVPGMGTSHHLLIASMAATWGSIRARTSRSSRRRRRTSWDCSRPARSTAMMGFPPQPQELRAGRIGHVVMNATTDRPWSQYFCCMLAASREFARRRPVAAKRALRALLKANDVCASEPDRVAQLYVDRGYADAARSPFIVQAMKELPYGRWPDYDAEDTVRFYALRLREAGLAPSSEVEG